MLEAIKIAGIEWQVEIVDEFEMSEKQKEEFRKEGHDPDEMIKWGEVTYEKNKINLWSGLSPQKKEQTLIHEMLHAIFHEAGFDLDNEDEVNRISIVLHQVLKDNDFSFLKIINKQL